MWYQTRLNPTIEQFLHRLGCGFIAPLQKSAGPAHGGCAFVAFDYVECHDRIASFAERVEVVYLCDYVKWVDSLFNCPPVLTYLASRQERVQPVVSFDMREFKIERVRRANFLWAVPIDF